MVPKSVIGDRADLLIQPLDSYQSTFAQNGKKFFARVDLARKFQGETHVGNRANFLEILHGSGLSGLGVKIRGEDQVILPGFQVPSHPVRFIQ